MDKWQVPAWNAKAPVPCTKEMLCAWLSARHDFDIVLLDTRAGTIEEATTRLPSILTILRAVEYRYGGGCPNSGDGVIPATWDIWAYVVANEKRARGGQQALPL